MGPCNHSTTSSDSAGSAFVEVIPSAHKVCFMFPTLQLPVVGCVQCKCPVAAAVSQSSLPALVHILRRELEPHFGLSPFLLYMWTSTSIRALGNT